jgi:hypothetical protein
MELSKDAKEVVQAILEEANVDYFSAESVSELLFNSTAAVVLARSVVKTLQYKLEQSQEITGNQSSMIEDLHGQMETTEQEHMGLQQQIEEYRRAQEVEISNLQKVRDDLRLQVSGRKVVQEQLSWLIADLFISGRASEYILGLFNQHVTPTTLSAELAMAQFYKNIEQGRVSLDDIAGSIKVLFGAIPTEIALNAATLIIDSMVNVHRDHLSRYMCMIKTRKGHIISMVVLLNDIEAHQLDTRKIELTQFAIGYCSGGDLHFDEDDGVEDVILRSVNLLESQGPAYVL